MAEYVVSAAEPEDMAQLVSRAYEAGLRDITWDTRPDGSVVVSGPYTEAELSAVSFIDPSWTPPLPPALRTHANHLRDAEQLIRDGGQLTVAQRDHVIADIIGWIRLTEPRL